MGLTVAVKVEHLPTACVSTTTPATDQSRVVLIPNLNPQGTVKSTLRKFIRENLYIPDELQCLTAPLFTKLSEQECVEDVYSRYCCQAEAEASELHVDEENFTFFGRERGMSVELRDDDRLDERHVIEESKLHLKRLPHSLPEQGGRIFVETKDGTLPLLGVRPTTQVLEIKQTLEKMTGIPVAQQLLSSVGRVMHDDFFVEDFDELHTVYEDSTLDLCKSGDTNAEQAHRRMAVQVNITGEQEFTLVVQGRDPVHLVMQVVESRTGYAPWQQRLALSGKVLQEKKSLADYFIYPECTLSVNIFKNPLKPSPKRTVPDLQEQSGQSLDAEKKPAARKLKLVRTSKGVMKGTLTIPVLTTDTVFDLKRKIKRTLQPLVERNFSMHSPIKEQTHIDITPKSSPAAGNLKPSRSMNSPSPTADYAKFSRTSVQSITRNFATGMSLNSPSRTPRSPLSTCSSAHDQVASPLAGGLPIPRRAPPIPSSVSSSSSSNQRQLEEFPPGNSMKLQSARRLQFGAASQSYCPSSNVASRELFPEPLRVGDTSGDTSAEYENYMMQETGAKHAKKSFGDWLNGSMQTLKDQFRAQFAEN